jgi:hypothetical protein
VDFAEDADDAIGRRQLGTEENEGKKENVRTIHLKSRVFCQSSLPSFPSISFLRPIRTHRVIRGELFGSIADLIAKAAVGLTVGLRKVRAAGPEYRNPPAWLILSGRPGLAGRSRASGSNGGGYDRAGGMRGSRGIYYFCGGDLPRVNRVAHRRRRTGRGQKASAYAAGSTRKASAAAQRAHALQARCPAKRPTARMRIAARPAGTFVRWRRESAESGGGARTIPTSDTRTERHACRRRKGCGAWNGCHS